MSKPMTERKINLFDLQEQLYNTHNFVVLARSGELQRDRYLRLMQEEVEQIMMHLGYVVKEVE